MSKIKRELYGVEQSCHGHCYRWIFDKAGLLSNNIEISGEEVCEDILFPIGGSNSSATSIKKLNTEEEIKAFLLGDYETDYEDPMLVDIAEGIVTIDVNDNCYGSITSEFVKQFNIPDEELTKENAYLQCATDMIKSIQERDASKCSGIDYENPFYGESRDMRLSELKNIFENERK